MGLPNLLQYYKGEGGVSRDPKFVLRNIWTAPNGQDYLKSKFSVGLRVVWAGGKNSLLDKTWPNGIVPVVLSNRSDSYSEGAIDIYHA